MCDMSAASRAVNQYYENIGDRIKRLEMLIKKGGDPKSVCDVFRGILGLFWELHDKTKKHYKGEYDKCAFDFIKQLDKILIS